MERADTMLSARNVCARVTDVKRALAKFWTSQGLRLLVCGLVTTSLGACATLASQEKLQARIAKLEFEREQVRIQMRQDVTRLETLEGSVRIRIDRNLPGSKKENQKKKDRRAL